MLELPLSMNLFTSELDPHGSFEVSVIARNVAKRGRQIDLGLCKPCRPVLLVNPVYPAVKLAINGLDVTLLMHAG